MIAHIHPDTNQEQSIISHLEGTAKYAKQIGSQLGMENLSYLTALFHDMGKFRLKFAQYLKNAFYNEERQVRGNVNHSSAGAIYIYQRYYKNNGLQKLTAQMICEAILSHHGLNDCMSVQGEDCFRKRVENLEGLDYEEVLHNFEQSGISVEDIDQKFALAMEEVHNIKNKIEQHELFEPFLMGLVTRMLLSILIDADRLDTAVFCGDRDSTVLEIGEFSWSDMAKNLEEKLNQFPRDKGIFAIRRQIANECLAFADRPSGIYRLAVPTGGAKTLSSMRYAIHHAKRYHKKRVFYIGPYLSILEQNSQVFRDALGIDDAILEHHSNVLIGEEDESKAQNRYRHLTENWDTPVVITTFVQFLNTLFGGKTSSIRRFHNLSDSVIIIDEIQSLPITMLYSFNMAMNYLHYLCDTTIVLCSATQPILEKIEIPIHYSTPIDMMSNSDDLYQKLKRVRIEAKKGVYNTEQLGSFLNQLGKEYKSILVILNTIEAVKKLYNEYKRIKEEEGEEITLIHLSTDMCPEHRLECIRYIKENGKDKTLVCISTSLIEAGVDLSFECVLRSYTGLDSIAQAAGRCNRNGEKKEGVAYLIHYEEERLGRLEQTRKGALCCESVIELFDNHKEIFHNDILSRPALEAYYQRYYFDPEQKQEMCYKIKEHNTNLVDLLSRNWTGSHAFFVRNGRNKEPDLALYQAFQLAGKSFCVINQNTTAVLVPYGEGEDIINRLNGKLSGKEIIKLIRKGQRFTVNLYRDKIEKLTRLNAIYPLNNGQILALASGFYDNSLGVVTEGKSNFLNI